MNYRGTLLILILAVPLWTWAIEINGVEVGENATLADGQQLSLNGAGVRSKFFVSIYVGALYLSSKTDSAQIILSSDLPKRVVLHIVHSKISEESMTDAWNDGFEKNLGEFELAALKPRVDSFNGLFPALKKGDLLVIDYTPQSGTTVNLNGQVLGQVPGADFHRAVMAIWLGEQPVTDSLKEAMLGLN